MIEEIPGMTAPDILLTKELLFLTVNVFFLLEEGENMQTDPDKDYWSDALSSMNK